MQPCEAKLYAEAAALWQEVCAEPPPAGLDAGALLMLALSRARDLSYERLHSPYLREAALSRPAPRPHGPRV